MSLLHVDIVQHVIEQQNETGDCILNLFDLTTLARVDRELEAFMREHAIPRDIARLIKKHFGAQHNIVIELMPRLSIAFLMITLDAMERTVTYLSALSLGDGEGSRVRRSRWAVQSGEQPRLVLQIIALYAESSTFACHPYAIPMRGNNSEMMIHLSLRLRTAVTWLHWMLVEIAQRNVCTFEIHQ